QGHAALVNGDGIFKAAPAFFELADDLLQLGQRGFKRKVFDFLRCLCHAYVTNPSLSSNAPQSILPCMICISRMRAVVCECTLSTRSQTSGIWPPVAPVRPTV